MKKADLLVPDDLLLRLGHPKAARLKLEHLAEQCADSVRDFLLCVVEQVTRPVPARRPPTCAAAKKKARSDGQTARQSKATGRR